MSRDELLALLDRDTHSVGLSVRAQAALLGLDRNRLYYQPVPPSPQALAVKRRIDEIYTVYPFYGIRRISAQLRAEGWAVNHKAVARHMREMGLAGIAPGPATSRGGKRASDSKYPYLLKGVVASYPNHVWGIDITYIRLSESWLYLVAVLDWYSRYVVSWELSQSLSQPFVTAAARAALQTATPLIWNSDQGSQFTSPQYTGLDCSRWQGYRSAWTGEAASWTTSSQRWSVAQSFDEPSNMRRSTCMNTPAPGTLIEG